MITPCYAKNSSVTVTWLGVAGFKITDGNTTLVFDPIISKPNLSHWLFNQTFSPNEDAVKEKIKDYGLTKVDAIFSSHCHFDHVIDVSMLAEKTGAIIYGGDSLEIIAKHYFREKTLPFVKVKDQSSIQIGEFKITFFERDHAAIFNLFHFLPGKISPSFSGKFYDFREGEVWSYRVEHPNATFVVDQGSHFHDRNKIFAGKTDVYLVGIANRKSIEDLVQNNIMIVKPKLVIPSHFDFFLLNWLWTESLNLPFIHLDKIKEEVFNRSLGGIKFLIPSKNKPIEVIP